MKNIIRRRKMIINYLEKQKETLVLEPEEWKVKCEELGLEKQAALMDESKSPIPFLRMTVEYNQVYEILCPTVCKLEEFGLEPIPMEVLGLVGLAITENYFDYMEVHYSEKNKDPVLVGVKKISKDKYDTKERYLMAQWGVENDNFEHLRERAKNKYINARKYSINKAIGEAQQQLENLDTVAEEYLNGRYISTIYF